ncbi:uncharacterized protein LOC131643606 [Vicia villosa]|uniref:uncharacterized protein LOC131643606 n=1 Tax=Vicia villosa TaxID=3911 RepID=UPI00273CE384|nr:uncharacterized protein LOC131643606 [Vicia villosa]
MTERASSSRGTKAMRYMKAPFKMLIKVKDMYIRGMIRCSTGMAGMETTMGYPTQLNFPTPESFNVYSRKSTTDDDDFKELVKSASLKIRQGGNGVDVGVKAMNVPPRRSRSVGMPTIKEEGEYDEEFESGDDDADIIMKVNPILSQSRTCVVRNGPSMF